MRINMSKSRTVAVVAACTASMLGGAQVASADTTPVSPDRQAGEAGVLNWDSYLSGVRAGFQSDRWADESYSQILFTNCDATNGANRYYSTDVDLRQDRPLAEDISWGDKHYTACFDGDRTSNGQWSGLSHGTYFFQIKRIGGHANIDRILGVKKVYVDTTKADS